MEILIVGAGGMARGIGLRLVRGGHQVRIADREPDSAAALAEELGASASGEALDSAAGAEVIVLAMPYESNKQVAEMWAGQLYGKIVVDISNPVDYETFDSLVTPPGKSAAEEIAEAAPGAHVVKAFNTTFASRLANTGRLDVFIAGDDLDSRKRIANLCTDADLRPIDVGGLKHALALESIQLLHMKVQGEIGGNWSTALTFAP
ncbi:NADPH-dependent F420 reductase [Glycomyces niveus]|uniref:NAD(P)-binding domain-containing protein n=1 Tax=Glycomyces niveus TaxID=2820287 RepID=A0ABS3U445_9ACTN|nr:NAD(P)-binding domain-containing protein [Glycomyces sp. NEAU-S30]MBO3733226.1 NAD(P)-binding domain-containing protein [Glycomyces sp. NEAU-S30]